MPVEPQDREAAAEYLPLADEECGECERGLMRSGEMDDHWLVQAFAAHREAAEQRGCEAERAEIVAWLRKAEQDYDDGDSDQRYALSALLHCADAIEFGQHREGGE